jgi:C-terminal processing protease CtpA/Prc
MEEVIRRARYAKGVIIDVRSNGGGNLGNALTLASAFTGESYTYGSVRIKTGPCADCFSSWNDLRVEAGNMQYDGPVIVLTNHASYSTTTYFAAMMQQNPNALLMGQPTGGGGGTPAFGELANGWTYRFSSTQTITADGEHFETGIPVDFALELAPIAFELISVHKHLRAHVDDFLQSKCQGCCPAK